MAELLLELLSEEIPASMQPVAAERISEGIQSALKAENVAYEQANCYFGPRRITVVIDGLPKVLPSQKEEKRGPRVGAVDKAIESFAAAAGLTVNELEVRETPKGEFYFAVKEQKEKPVSELLVAIIQEKLNGYQWPKSMKWGEHSVRWVRPLHHIVCLFDGDVLPVKFGHVQASNTTYGHRFLANEPIVVSDFKSYQAELKKKKVIIDFEERKKIISEEAERLASGYGVQLRQDNALLEETAGLVEWPVPVIGKIEKQFLELPEEVLIASMKNHQKYFSVVDKKGKLAPYFVAIANTDVATAKGNKILDGFERVLRARLEDGKFFWDADRRVSLESRLDALKKVIFHAKLGTVNEKVERISALSKFLSVWVPHANLVLVEKAAHLCKADLVTEMVHEFSELQGTMGYYYALESREPEDVAIAVRDHYKPVGAQGKSPDNPLAIAVGIADKIDSLVGLFLIGEKPTGSKDPFALRRAALGVIRTILDNNLRIPLTLLFEKAVSFYPKSVLKANKELYAKPKDLVDDLVLFTVDRLKVLLKDEGVRHDYIQAVFSGGEEDDLVRLVAKVKALKDFLAVEEGCALLSAYKRANNIVVSEQKKNKRVADGEPDEQLLEAEEERALFTTFKTLAAKVQISQKEEDFQAMMQEMVALKQPIDLFFDKVVVNCDDSALKRNRLRLLSQFVVLFTHIGNFSQISDE
jgi:glycyl-tRNA synthetase beta chain